MSPRFLLIDGHYLAYRSFFALPSTLTFRDQPVNAVLGFFNILLNAIEVYQPEYLCVCFDRKEPTYRNEIYPPYKAHRPPSPPEFFSQIPIIKSLLTSARIFTWEEAGFEADDLIGTLTRKFSGLVSTWIVTGDLDTLQLVNEETTVLVPQKGTVDLLPYTPDAVKEKLGLLPCQVVDFKAIKGDKSDNIPGVPGLGEKTAVKLLEVFHTLQGIYENLGSISPSGAQIKLIENREMAFLSQHLATINCEVPLSQELSDFKFHQDWNLILNTLATYSFTNTVRRFEKHRGQDQVTAEPLSPIVTLPDGHYHVIKTVAELQPILPKLRAGFAVDLETTSLNPNHAEIVGISLCVTPKEAYYLPLNDFLKSDGNQQGLLFSQMGTRDEARVSPPLLSALSPFLEDPDIPKITHNGKYEWQVFTRYGISFQGIHFDTMLAAFILSPEGPMGLKALAASHLGFQMTHYEDLVGKGKSKIAFSAIPIEEACRYACADADFTYRLYQLFEPKITGTAFHHLLSDIDIPVMTVLGKMEKEGVCIDVPYLHLLRDKFKAQCEGLQKEIFELAGGEFNLNSPKQVGDILFNKLGLESTKKTKTGVSTDASVLEKLKDKHPIANAMSRYRILDKLMNTYILALPALIDPQTGRIHTSFNQTIAVTGRLSSTQPNLQNIPIRTTEGKQIRQAFIPSAPDRWILSADYSQIELRLMADLAEDPNMIAAFSQGEDIHRSTAAAVFGLPLDEVTSELRYRAKAINFGIIYGISAFGLSENLRISRGEAKEIIDEYFLKFPRIKQFMDDTISFAETHGYVETLFGRRRSIPDIRSPIFNRRSFAQRTAINTRTQGTAADLMKVAMIRIQNEIERQGLLSRMIIQVHDELVFDVVDAEKDRLLEISKRCMSQAASLKVPLVVDAVFGKNWQDLD